MELKLLGWRVWLPTAALAACTLGTGACLALDGKVRPLVGFPWMTLALVTALSLAAAFLIILAAVLWRRWSMRKR